MNRSLPSIIAGTVLVLALGLYMVTFQVRFTEVAVVRTFGKASEKDVITDPGLNWKMPWPIQSVSVYDNRMQLATTTGEETPTLDGKNVIVTTAIGWRIDNPYKFSIRCADLKDAAGKLRTRVRNDQKTVIARYKFANMISTDTEELHYDQLEREILESVQDKARELYGVRVEFIGIEKLALPERITQTVFDAMKKERQAVAARYTSEGLSTAQQIKDTAEGIAGTILAFADRKAAEIVAEGRRRAAKYNETFRQDESLAIFLLELETLKRTLKKRATIILDADQRPWHLLRESQEGQTKAPNAKTDEKQRVSSTANVASPGFIKVK